MHNTLDCALMAVHVPSINMDNPIEDELSKFFWPMYNHIRMLGIYMKDNFSGDIIEVIRADSVKPYPNKPIMKDFGSITAYSEDGKLSIADLQQIRVKRIILTGMNFGVCHLNAFKSLVESQVEEIHIPIQATRKEWISRSEPWIFEKVVEPLLYSRDTPLRDYMNFGEENQAEVYYKKSILRAADAPKSKVYFYPTSSSMLSYFSKS